MPLTRMDFQALARTRLREARLLRQSRRFDGAYYLVGLAVECALKACIARHTRRYDFPDRRIVEDSYTHDLTKLVRTANLQSSLERECSSNDGFARNWAVVKDWRIDSRYAFWTRQQAEDLYRAVTGRRNGVFRWIQQHW